MTEPHARSGAESLSVAPIALKVAGADALTTDATRFITIVATPTNATSFAVTLDGVQLGLTANQPHTRPISSGAHLLIAFVMGDPGASLSVAATIPGQQGVTASCFVGPGGQSAAAPAPFNVS